MRYAGFAAFHGTVVVAAVVGVLGSSAGVVLLLASIPLLFAWGHFQVDVARNPELDESERNRWRAVLWLLPWSMTLYWQRHVRPRQAVD